jgi:hypothetical protein
MSTSASRTAQPRAADSLLWLTLVRLKTLYEFMLIPICIMAYVYGIAKPARTQIIISAPSRNLSARRQCTRRPENWVTHWDHGFERARDAVGG